MNTTYRTRDFPFGFLYLIVKKWEAFFKLYTQYFLIAQYILLLEVNHGMDD